MAQIMPGTAVGIAKELNDKNFPANTPNGKADIVEYLKIPEVSKRYGRYYLRKQLKDFGGDVDLALMA